MNAEFTVPQARYAESDGLSMAWQVLGEGAQDLVIRTGLHSGEWPVWRAAVS